ncbi:interferon-inducible GTPase 5-like [Sceloporus undulatus]|uniref:interferon-inducible GTPase 5-like n=1 Tax=Sceloporus undulatus TaxID=8520 RepID=UPI001C4AF7DA|nr:interferon-inducible GTPase 5-like [Sceloporus undulatus]
MLPAKGSLGAPSPSAPPSPREASAAVVSAAVAGRRGAGKSALLALLLLRRRSACAGGTSPASSSASSPGPRPALLPHPEHPNRLFWELRLGEEERQEEEGGRWAAEAEALVLVAGSRGFGAAEARVAEEARAAGRSVFFVRSQADLELHTLRRRMEGRRFDREEALGALRGACAEGLRAAGVPGEPPVFLVSAFEPREMDAPRLHTALMEDLAARERALGPPQLDFEVISEREAAEIQEAYALGGLSEVVTRVQCRLETLWATRLDVAITGESGAGKSTFINALRGLGDEEEGAAATGVTETTARPTPYPYPGHANVTLWDLPGIGTPSFRPDGYLEAVDFGRYDFFLILASERFKESHVLLARAIVSQGKLFYFIRTKVDNDLESARRRRSPPAEEAVLAEIRGDCKARLAEAGLPVAPVFLLNSFEIERFDFPLFEETLERELPGHKRQAFLLALPNLSSVIIERKRQLLHQEVWKVALVSSLVAAVPLPGLGFTCDVSILLRKLSTYRQDFGLDAASLARLAERSRKPMEALRAEVRSTLGRSISREVVIALLGKATGTGLVVANFLVHRIPIYGALASGGISFHTTYSMLSQCLEGLATDSQQVLLKACESKV